MIGCSSISGEIKGEAITWTVFVRPHRSLRRLFGGRSPNGAVQRVTHAVTTAMAAKGIDVQQLTPLG
jgi:hypothetical protein